MDKVDFKFKVGDKVIIKGNSFKIGNVTEILTLLINPYKVYFSNLPSDFGLYREEELETIGEVLNQFIQPNLLKETAIKEKLIGTLQRTIETYQDFIRMFEKDKQYRQAYEYQIRAEELNNIIELIKHTD